MTTVMVLNADLSPLHRVTVQHAVRMLLREVAEVYEAGEGTFGPFAFPRAVRLVRYVVTRWRFTSGPAWSRGGVLRRDKRMCGYCGVDDASTVDHIVPVSRGGGNTWMNTVAACNACNQRKGDRTPHEAGLTLRVTPRRPLWIDVVH